MTTYGITVLTGLEAFRQSSCLFNNRVAISSRLGGDVEREAGAPVNGSGRAAENCT